MIRQLRPDEVDQFMDMTQVAFAVTFSEDDLKARSKQVVPEQIWGYYLEDRLAARIAIIPFETYLEGEKYKMGGIAHVATYPEMRRNGMVGKLMTHSLEVMRANGQTISMLNPFAYGFYRKYGWEWFCDHTTYSMDIQHVPRFKDASGTVKRGSAADLETINRIYDQYAMRYNGMLVRTEEWWKSTVLRRKLGSLAMSYDEAGEPNGYMLYTIRDRKMRISEFLALSFEGRKSLWQFIANHDSILDKVDFNSPLNDPVMMLVGEPDKVEREYFSYFMFRIVDWQALAGRFRFEKLTPGTELLFDLTDEHASWNSGTWRLVWLSDGGVSVTRLEAEEASACATAARCKLDIRTLSAIVCGFRRPSAMAEIGRIHGDAASIALLERAMPRRLSLIIDMF
ncbi:GNAT family N-acetyltransferase [Paenibacillus koleovorans]|uniref:GNAT family N-acetyltransferase n=1 Tax=Paenibacillus koleovorans TaxID=121608 RepID=UPI000FD6D8F6|nr:GNAT family N-acetyltransferase [Paenibacillus koleovorans]